MFRRKDNRRKNYFIKKKFQGDFIFKFCALVVLGLVISGFILYRFSRGTVTTTFVDSRLSIVSTADYILPGLLASSLITIILISIAAALVVMYLSHRIAGPLFRFEKSTQEIGKGDLTLKIKLRSTDEIAKLADCFNEMLDNLKQHLLEIKKKSEDLTAGIDKLTAPGREKIFPSGEIEAVLKELSEKKKELDEAIGYFKL